MQLFSFLAAPFARRSAKSNAGTALSIPRPPEPELDPAPQPAEDAQQDPQQVAEQLLGRLQPLWLSRQGLDMDVRFQMGRMLWEGLYPSGQDRLPYGSQVMQTVSQRLGICRPDLHRMVKLAREYTDLAAFQAQHPGVTTWDGVKKALAQTKPAQAGSPKRKPTDPAKVVWRRIDKGLKALKQDLASVPHSTKPQDAAKRESAFQSVGAAFQKLLVDRTVTSENR